MKLKAKLISTIAAFAMVLCLTIVGVWAATTVTVNVTGNVSYIAKDVNATVTGSIIGVVGAAEKTYSHTFNAATTNEQATDSWDLTGLTFVKNQDVVITLTVTNNSTEVGLTAKLTNNTKTEENVEITLSEAQEVQVGTEADSKTKTFKFTIHVKDWNKSTNYSINLSLSLTSAKA